MMQVSSAPPSPHSQIAHPSDEKGLRNRAGENNCFLNVTIQSLWHLQPFRDLFESKPVRKRVASFKGTIILVNVWSLPARLLMPLPVNAWCVP